MDNQTLILCVGSAVFAFCLIAIVIVLSKKKKQKREQYLDSPATDSDIRALFHEVFPRMIQRTTEEEWRLAGRNMIKQNGDYRVDFIKAAQKKTEDFYLMGVSEESVLQYFRAHGGNPQNRNASRAICDAIKDIIVTTQTRISQGLSWGGMSPDDFFVFKKQVNGDSVGVYIIYNQTKNMYYVGQAKRLCFRVNQHFTGHGNGDVYADYKYGDQFLIKLITLRESGYDDLDKLERDMIMQYHANIDGYNKTAGNYSS